MKSNSDVLCRQLGLGHALDHWLHDPDENDTSFLYTHMNCDGSEDRLRLCNHSFTVDNMCVAEVPWVLCSGEWLCAFGMWRECVEEVCSVSL